MGTYIIATLLFLALAYALYKIFSSGGNCCGGHHHDHDHEKQD